MRYILFIFFIFVNCIYSQYYSLADYINFLEKDHTFLKQQQSIIDQSKHDYLAASSIEDWSMNHSIYTTHVSPYQTSSFSSSKYDSFGTSFGISRPVLNTGGLIDFSINNLRLKQDSIVYNGITFGEPLYYENDITLSYTQPLLFGFAGEVLKTNLIITSTNVKNVSLESMDAYEDFLYQQLNQYIQWFLQHEITELNYRRLQLAKESLNQTNERFKVNLSEKIDVLRAEYSVQKAYQQWLMQKSNLKSFQLKLASLTGDTSIISKLPIYDLYETVYVKKPSYIIVDKLRVIQATVNQQIPLNQELKLNKSKRYGELNIVGSYSFIGGSTNFSDSMEYNKNNSSVYFNYSRSLSDSETKAIINSNNEKIKQLDLYADQLKKTLKSEIIGLHTTIKEYELILDGTLEQIIIAQKKATEEEAIYTQGRSSIDLVIQAQDNVLNSKLNYATLFATYHQYVIQYQALTDELLTNYSITL